MRGKFGFDGIIISDASSINEMLIYGICKDLEECCEKAMCAGVDIDLGGISYSQALEKAVLLGKVSETLIDEAVLRILEKKYALGLFEQPYSQTDKSCVFSKEHLHLAEKLALESAVLLKNNGILPLLKQKKIAIVGKYADSKDVLGCWQNSSHIEDIATLQEVFVQSGYSVVGVSQNYDIDRVQKVIKDADVILFTCGEFSEQSGEAHSRQNLHLTQEEIDCYQYIKTQTKDIVNEEQVVKFDDTKVSFEDAAVSFISTFPLAAIRKVKLEIGESLMVMGLGILGQLAVKLARVAGACPIIACDPVKERREEALRNGADYAFDPLEKDFAKQVRAVADGGVKTAIEVTGVGAGLDETLDCMAEFGRVALLGCTRSSDFSIDYYNKVHFPGITLVGAHTHARAKQESSHGNYTHNDDIKAVLKLCGNGRLTLKDIVKETHAPKDCGAVYTRLVQDKNFPVGVQFDWRKE